MKVGFIGLGTMGAYMAANLSKYLEASNHGLVVHDVRREIAHCNAHCGRRGAGGRVGLYTACGQCDEQQGKPCPGKPSTWHAIDPPDGRADRRRASTAASMARHWRTIAQIDGRVNVFPPPFCSPSGAVV